MREETYKVSTKGMRENIQTPTGKAHEEILVKGIRQHLGTKFEKADITKGRGKNDFVEVTITYHGMTEEIDDLLGPLDWTEKISNSAMSPRESYMGKVKHNQNQKQKRVENRVFEETNQPLLICGATLPDGGVCKVNVDGIKDRCEKHQAEQYNPARNNKKMRNVRQWASEKMQDEGETCTYCGDLEVEYVEGTNDDYYCSIDCLQEMYNND